MDFKGKINVNFFKIKFYHTQSFKSLNNYDGDTGLKTLFLYWYNHKQIMKA